MVAYGYVCALFFFLSTPLPPVCVLKVWHQRKTLNQKNQLILLLLEREKDFPETGEIQKKSFFVRNVTTTNALKGKEKRRDNKRTGKREAFFVVQTRARFNKQPSSAEKLFIIAFCCCCSSSSSWKSDREDEAVAKSWSSNDSCVCVSL